MKWRANSLAQKIEMLTDKRGPDECWPWKGSLTPDGYAQLSWMGKNYRVGRVLLDLEAGDKRQARHTCDYPPCVNKGHLIPGTTKQNFQDLKERKPGSYKKRANGIIYNRVDYRASALFGGGIITASNEVKKKEN